MKALSLTQPWAQLVALGRKTLETRSWRTDYAGPLAIHATKDIVTAGSLEPELIAALGAPLPLPQSGTWRYTAVLPTSCVVAVVTLGGCVRTQDVDRVPGVTVTDLERRFGNFARGRWAWILRDVEVLAEPVPCSGARGVWDLPTNTEARVARQLKVVAL